MLFRKCPDMTAKQLMRAAFRAVPPPRAEDRKNSHRGFDWRVLFRTLQEAFLCEHIEYSPLPYRDWYGQRQVLTLFRKP